MRNKESLTFILPDLDLGGTQRVLVYLVNSLVKKGFEIKIIVFKKVEKKIFDLSNKVLIKNLKLHKKTTNIFEKIFFNIHRVKKIRNEIKKNNSSKLISFLTTANILTLISSVGLKKEIIINERNDPAQKKIPFFWKILRFLIYRNADKILINQPNVKKSFIYKNLFFIPNPITTSPGKEVKKKKIILSVARLDYQKNIELLIKSFSKSKAIQKNWKLIIFGKGKEKKKLLILVNKLGISNFVIFKGTTEKISYWYKKSEIFALSSRFEGMPNSLIEAMNYKLAVIGTRIPGINFFIKNKINGLLFEVNNEKELTKHINFLIKNKTIRRNLGNKAFKYVNKLANPNEFINRWLNHLK